MNIKKQLQGSLFPLIITLLTLIGCKQNNEKDSLNVEKPATVIPTTSKPTGIKTPEGMIWVPGRSFMQGAVATDYYAMPREKPAHPVIVDGFFIDATEVTNQEFATFVQATAYVTVAERPIDWEVMKKELPAGTPKPHDSILRPGSLVFNKEVRGVVGMENYGQWWTWKIGANWKQPYGPRSSIDGKEDYPVIHIAYEDALAYCKWANRRLPTEAEWELAAQGKNNHSIFTWGADASQLEARANTWTGKFPTENTGKDGFEYLAPTKSFAPNSLGIYDMLGNVWEWTSDIYNQNYYVSLDGDDPEINPRGASEYYNPQNPYQVEMVMKGGSYLCHDSYCASFRISARMSTSKDSGSDHLGFRTVATVDMLE